MLTTVVSAKLFTNHHALLLATAQGATQSHTLYTKIGSNSVGAVRLSALEAKMMIQESVSRDITALASGIPVPPEKTSWDDFVLNFVKPRRADA